MDTYIWQALTTGRVTLPDETIPARVWFRLLRTIIDEITDLPADFDNMRAALQPAGAGVRPAGTEQDNWQPYEGLDCYAQDRALQAAAAVIAALQDGTITGHGTAAHLFRSTSRPHADRAFHRPRSGRLSVSAVWNVTVLIDVGVVQLLLMWGWSNGCSAHEWAGKSFVAGG